MNVEEYFVTSSYVKELIECRELVSSETIKKQIDKVIQLELKVALIASQKAYNACKPKDNITELKEVE